MPRRTSTSGARPRRSRTGVAIAAVLALAVLAWLLWPVNPVRVEPPRAAPAAATASRVERIPRKAPSRRAPAPSPQRSTLDEGRVRAAVLARAGDLRACGVPAGAPSQVPVRLRVPASGQVRSVQLGGPDPLPPALSSCLREKLLLWRFDDLQLSSDVDLFATFALR